MRGRGPEREGVCGKFGWVSRGLGQELGIRQGDSVVFVVFLF